MIINLILLTIIHKFLRTKFSNKLIGKKHKTLIIMKCNMDIPY